MASIEVSGADEVRAGIAFGLYDEDLEAISDAIKDRKSALTDALRRELQVGDKVRFAGTVRPKYLAGVEGEIVAKKQKNVTVDVGRQIGKFSPRITTPVALIEKV